MSKDSGKRQLSISVSKELADGLDDWIKWQKDNRSYEIDRSHVFNVLLKRFLDINQIPENFNSSLDLDFDIE